MLGIRNQELGISPITNYGKSGTNRFRRSNLSLEIHLLRFENAEVHVTASESEAVSRWPPGDCFGLRPRNDMIDLIIELRLVTSRNRLVRGFDRCRPVGYNAAHEQ